MTKAKENSKPAASSTGDVKTTETDFASTTTVPAQDGVLQAASENQFPNRDSQRVALLSETVPCDAVTSGFVSDLFTVRIDEKGQTMLVICLQFPLSKNAKQSIMTGSNVFNFFTSV